jgi:hypothetical protein
MFVVALQITKAQSNEKARQINRNQKARAEDE